MTEKDLQAREKVEVTGQAESTRSTPVYVPAVDIYESADNLTLVADMPGVAPENITIDIKDNQLSLRGTVSPENEKEQIILQEYGVGDFYREFTLGKAIDQSKIEATMKDGVLVVTLPKAEAVKPRKIAVKTG
jgi:HSP20 family protein